MHQHSSLFGNMFVDMWQAYFLQNCLRCTPTPSRSKYILIYNQFKEFTFPRTHRSTITQVYAKNCLISSKNSVCFKFFLRTLREILLLISRKNSFGISDCIDILKIYSITSQRNYRLLLFGGTINRNLFYLAESFIQIYRNQV